MNKKNKLTRLCVKGQQKLYLNIHLINMGKENKYPHTRIYHNKYLTELREEDITPELIEDMNKLFTSMGYDVDSDIPVWQQFHIRHGLPIN